MARPISSDRILINRDGVDYQTSYGEVNTPVCDLPLIPGPPVIALKGAVQVAPAEPGEPIVIIRNGDGPDPRTNQWQRGSGGLWTNIAGATGVDYNVTEEDKTFNVRLEQTFSDGSELHSNEIVVTNAIPLPWDDWNGGIWHIENVTGAIVLETGPHVAWNIDGTNQREIEEIAVGEELVFVTGPDVTDLFGEGNERANWDFGEYTDTSKVTKMVWMLFGTEQFNGTLGGNWDTSNVTNMEEILWGAFVFNQDINGWDVSNVRDFQGAFTKAYAFNKPLDNWVTSSATTMRFMFKEAYAFNQDISGWDTSKVDDMTSMFREAWVFDQDISTKQVTVDGNTYTAWDTSNVEYMGEVRWGGMFMNARAFNQDIGNWNTSKVLEMSRMFQGARAFNQDIGTKEVTVGSNTYTAWDTSNVTDMENLFEDASVFNQDISNWDTSSVIRVLYPDYELNGMALMFKNASAFNQDLSDWCVSVILFEPWEFDVGATDWTASKPCWGHCPRGENGTPDPCPAAPWEDPQFAGRLYHIKNVQDGPLELNGYYKPYQAWDMDRNELSLNEVAEGQEVVIYAGPEEDGSVYLFGMDDNTTWEFGRFTNTSKVENFSFIFQGAYKFNSPLTGFDTRSAKRLDNVFSYAMAFDQDISDWDVSNCPYFYAMFQGAETFNQDISGWDVSNAETGTWTGSMDTMFYGAEAFNQDLSNWCVKNIATQPTEFDQNATAWTKPRPNWGAPC